MTLVPSLTSWKIHLTPQSNWGHQRLKQGMPQIFKEIPFTARKVTPHPNLAQGPSKRMNGESETNTQTQFVSRPFLEWNSIGVPLETHSRLHKTGSSDFGDILHLTHDHDKFFIIFNYFQRTFTARNPADCQDKPWEGSKVKGYLTRQEAQKDEMIYPRSQWCCVVPTTQPRLMRP